MRNTWIDYQKKTSEFLIWDTDGMRVYKKYTTVFTTTTHETRKFETKSKRFKFRVDIRISAIIK